ncbi:MAG: thiamine pyrophosphate-dependent enzyme [Proteobacteria bacterium]|nr:thiamine pyrophosphate-dependent enzyme [Pseudomonadota bacterium]
MSEPTAAFLDWFAARLRDAGLRRAFGVPGGGASLDLIAALRRRSIETIVTAREDAAVMMAGVSGVLAGGPGLAFTTKGPGLANATNGLASAALDRMPALLVSETFDKAELEFLSHQVFSQTALVAPLLLQAHGEVLPAEQDAVEGWLNGENMAPAVMFPSTLDFKQQVSLNTRSMPRPAPETPSIDQALVFVQASRRPVVIVGLEAARRAVASHLRAFVDRLGAPVLCTYMAKGCIADDDPHYAGIFTGGAIEQATMEAADLIILIGLDPVELIRKPWTYQAPVLDLAERLYEPHYLLPAGRIIAPLPLTLSALAATIEGCDWRSPEIAELRNGFLRGMEAGDGDGLSATAVVKAACAAFSNHPRLSIDAGAHMFSACAFWPGRAPRDILISNGLASMGFAVPAAIAAALHEPARGAIAMTGDGGLLMCLGELKTAVETRANIIIIVYNDGRLSLIDIKREDRQMPDLGLTWTAPDFAAIAKGFGFKSWQVKQAADLAFALNAAADDTGPRLIDIRIDAAPYRAQLRALRG